MYCPKCQKKTKVLDTRSPSGKPTCAWVKSLLEHGERVFGWWSDDFRMRKRQCESCGLKFMTIEVTAADLEDAFTEAMQGELVGVPWKTLKKPFKHVDE